MNVETLHGKTDNQQGWLRLGLQVISLVATLAISFASIKANLDAQATAIHELSAKVDKLSDSIRDLAITTEGMKHDVSDTKQRVERVENQRDGRKP